MIGIVDYGSGNIQAISNIFSRLAIPFLVIAQPEDLAKADKVLLPGVGAFDQAMTELNASGMRDALDESVVRDERPILGICVGMQLLGNRSEEGKSPGLGWIDATVRRFDPLRFAGRAALPHMGWNTVTPTREHPLFMDVDLSSGYYFLHSYYFDCQLDSDILGVTSYGSNFVSVVQRRNIFGVQFHPEKSHRAGIQLLKNFAEM